MKQLLVIIFFLTANLNAFCCECDVLGLKNAWTEAEIILYGKAIKTEVIDQLFLGASDFETSLSFHKFIVIEDFGGHRNSGDTLTLTSEPSNYCSWEFEDGKEYLVFLNSNGLLLKTSHCDGTKEFDKFNDSQIQKLRKFGKKQIESSDKTYFIDPSEKITRLERKIKNLESNFRYSKYLNVFLLVGLLFLIIKRRR